MISCELLRQGVSILNQTERELSSVSKIEQMLANVSSLYVFNTVFYFGLTVLLLYTLYIADGHVDLSLGFALAAYGCGLLFKVAVHGFQSRFKPNVNEQELLFATINASVTFFAFVALVQHNASPDTLLLLHSFVPSVLWLLVYPIAVRRPVHDRGPIFYGFYGFLEWAVSLLVFAWAVQGIYQLFVLHAWTGILSNLMILSGPAVVRKVRKHHLDRLTDRIKSEIYRDVLTGLDNRRAFYDFYDAVRQGVRESRRSLHVPEQHLALIFADIDYFKKFNDRYGHEAGDECLKSVAAFLRNQFEPLGFKVYRIGGEEFVLCGFSAPEAIADMLASSDVLHKWCDRNMILPIKHQDSPFGAVTLSGGLVVVDQQDIYSSNAAGITKLADQLLYVSKSERNKLTVADAALQHMRLSLA